MRYVNNIQCYINNILYNYFKKQEEINNNNCKYLLGNIRQRQPPKSKKMIKILNIQCCIYNLLTH